MTTKWYKGLHDEIIDSIEDNIRKISKSTEKEIIGMVDDWISDQISYITSLHNLQNHLPLKIINIIQQVLGKQSQRVIDDIIYDIEEWLEDNPVKLFPHGELIPAKQIQYKPKHPKLHLSKSKKRHLEKLEKKSYSSKQLNLKKKFPNRIGPIVGFGYPWFNQFADYSVRLLEKYLGNYLPGGHLISQERAGFVADLEQIINEFMKTYPLNRNNLGGWYDNLSGFLYDAIGSYFQYVFHVNLTNSPQLKNLVNDIIQNLASLIS